MVLRDVFKYDTLVVGSPTYNGELFPEVEALLSRIAARCVPQRNFAYFGSYTWAGAAVRRFAEFAERMKWQTPARPSRCSKATATRTAATAAAPSHARSRR